MKYALMSMFPLAVFRLNCSAETSPTSTPPLAVFILSFSKVLSGRYTSAGLLPKMLKLKLSLRVSVFPESTAQNSGESFGLSYST